MRRGFLKLDTGALLEGELVGYSNPKRAKGELVFTTSMVGYTETLSDPSYYGQMVIFAYPLIGNYGVPKVGRGPIPNPGFESFKIQASGVIMGTMSPDSYHWNQTINFEQWLKKEKVTGLTGIDTRRLIQIVRSRPKTLAQIQSKEDAEESFFDPNEENVLPKVSVKKIRTVGDPKADLHIGLIDCGVKWSILRRLVDYGCRVSLIPWSTDLKSLGALEIDGWVISNGPGNPVQTEGLVDQIGSLLKEDRPILGICLGHQLLSLAAGARTARLPFGHRSFNQPVIDPSGKKGYITSQNHGYEVVRDSIPPNWEAWFTNLNDRSIEGIRHQHSPFRGVQFHPEACGGPRDTLWIFEDFLKEVRASK